VASWREGSLLLIVTDGHWATRLRYQQKRLQRQLQMFDEFANLTRILFKVQPPTVQQGAAGHTMDLSTMPPPPFRQRPTASATRPAGSAGTIGGARQAQGLIKPMWERARSHRFTR
jgi:hypothetical protein